MKIRFALDENLYADLIGTIRARANGASHNKAAKLLFIEFFAIQKSVNGMPNRTVPVTTNPTRKTHHSIPGYIYLIQADLPDNPCKIGLSKNVPNRMDLFTVKLPFDFELIHSFPADIQTRAETILHTYFDAKRLNGEWFNLDRSDIDYIRSIERYEDGEFINIVF